VRGGVWAKGPSFFPAEDRREPFLIFSRGGGRDDCRSAGRWGDQVDLAGKTHAGMIRAVAPVCRSVDKTLP